VAGDPAHDRVLERIPDLTAFAELRSWASGKFTMVAGSVEPTDQATLSSAAERALTANPLTRAIVVPHDPEPGLAANWSAGPSISTQVWRRGDRVAGDPQLIVVAESGLLADLYALGDLAYVGGGFRRHMLHSVAEPAAYGLPVVCGPHLEAQWDARALGDAGGLHSLTSNGAGTALTDRWNGYVEEPESRQQDGIAARTVLRAGAARRAATEIGSRIGA